MPWKSASFIGVVLTYFPPPYQTENEGPAFISNDRISLVVNFIIRIRRREELDFDWASPRSS
jgi:hypothetical protein